MTFQTLEERSVPDPRGFFRHKKQKRDLRDNATRELFNILQSSNIRDASFDDAREALLQQSTLLMEEEEER